jgi:hypothetical protein
VPVSQCCGFGLTAHLDRSAGSFAAAKNCSGNGNIEPLGSSFFLLTEGLHTFSSQPQGHRHLLQLPKSPSFFVDLASALDGDGSTAWVRVVDAILSFPIRDVRWSNTRSARQSS